MKKNIFNLLGGGLFSLPMLFASCGNGDNALEEIINGGGSGGSTPTVEEVIKYGFKVTDLAGVDRTEAVTSLKMSNEDGTLVVEAEVSGGKITITNTKLTKTGITAAADFWFEAEIGGKPYIAKVNIDPTTLSPESDKTLEMATLGDVILSDGKFAAAEATGAVAKICYLGSETAEAAPYNHGLALALSDASTSCKWKTEKTDAGHTKQTSSTFTEESGLQYNAMHNSEIDNYPAFKAAINFKDTKPAPTGCSAWFLASGYQWNQMLGANGYGLANLKATANGYTGLEGYYWSSTEYDASLAWDLYYYNGNCNKVYKTDDYRVRACLAF